ncbi:NTP transferase domain-containing protein, partial [Corallococcus exiguus]|nr:NTP transferase domain-containing protein [Corallococcus exiguus]
MNADAATVRDLTLGVILAGGRAARMGGQDKSLVRLGEHRVLDHLLHRLTPQCAQVVLNANGDPSRFGERDPIVVPDSLP